MLVGHTTRVAHMTALPDGSAVSADARGALLLWAPDGSSRPLPASGAPITRLAPEINGHVITGDTRGTILRLSRCGRDWVGEELRAEGAPITALSALPDGQVLAGCRDGSIVRFPLAASRPHPGHPLEEHDGPVRALAGSPAGKIFSVGEDSVVKRHTPQGSGRWLCESVALNIGPLEYVSYVPSGTAQSDTVIAGNAGAACAVPFSCPGSLVPAPKCYETTLNPLMQAQLLGDRRIVAVDKLGNTIALSHTWDAGWHEEIIRKSIGSAIKIDAARSNTIVIRRCELDEGDALCFVSFLRRHNELESWSGPSGLIQRASNTLSPQQQLAEAFTPMFCLPDGRFAISGPGGLLELFGPF